MNNIDLRFENDLQLFHEATKIPFCVFNDKKEASLRYPFIEAMNCSPTTIDKCCKVLGELPTDCHLPIIYSSDFCFVALLKLDQNTNVMFGPVSPTPLTYQEFYNANKDKSDPDDLTYLYRVMQQSPQISLAQFASNLSLFIKLAFQDIISAQEILSKQIMLSKSATISTTDSIPKPHSLTIMEALNFQKRILFYLQSGNMHELRHFFDNTHFFSDLRSGSSSMEEFQKLSFIFATLCCVAAIEEGLDSQKAFSIFDTYIYKIPSLTIAEQLEQWCVQLSIDYCQQITNLHHFHSGSPVVTQCLQYIQNNICSKISICDLANHCNVSKRTITRHFSEYYHMSVYEYILLSKLKEAAFLLTHSDFSLAEISACLSFSSQSHFCVTFKKLYYYTPQQYREEFKNRNYE